MKKVSFLLFLTLQCIYLSCVEEKSQGPMTSFPREILYEIAFRIIMPEIDNAKTLLELENAYKNALSGFTLTSKKFEAVARDKTLPTNKQLQTISKDRSFIEPIKAAYEKKKSKFLEELNKINDLSKFNIPENGVNKKNESGDTPLTFAASVGNANAIRLLIDNGANINAKNNEGETALMVALTNSRDDVAKLLISKKPDVNIQDNKDDTALIIAAGASRPLLDIVNLLISNGANINIKNKSGKTALGKAIFYGKNDLAKLLIGKKADVNIQDNNGDTPLMSVAGQFGNVALESVKLLINNGANVNIQNNNGDTALMIAARAPLGTLEIASLLISKGADINIKNKKSETALDIAKVKRNTSIVQLLENHKK